MNTAARFVNSSIEREYRAMTPGSAALAERAHASLPSGLTHDSRHLAPYGPYVDRAAGPVKWDVDGNRLVDYFGGHGALLLGHNHPEVMSAVGDALARGTHFGSSHLAEVEWAEQVRAMVPCAEWVRFTSSGTEATHMALRLARAYTGRNRVLRFRTHFHGWHDHMASGYSNHFDGSPATGIVPGIAADTVLVDPNDEAGVRAAFADGPPIAAIILEPTGSSTGMVPTDGAFLAFLREVASEHGAQLIFDEVVTGFRVSPGGAQAHYGVTPDLATFAKIVAGGLPGGCVAGRAEILERLDFEVASRKGFEKIAHPGTYNANPVSAAAGVTALRIIEDGEVCERATRTADRIKAGMNAVLAERGVPWAAYGTFSAFHVFTNPKGRSIDPLAFDATTIPVAELRANPPGIAHKVRMGMIINGVDLNGWPGGTVSAAHTDEEVTATVDAFSATLDLLDREGAL